MLSFNPKLKHIKETKKYISLDNTTRELMTSRDTNLFKGNLKMKQNNISNKGYFEIFSQ